MGPSCVFPLTLPALECLDWAVITPQQHSHRAAEPGLQCICPALFHTQLSTQESYCHETLDVLGSLILVTQSRNVFLEGVSRCPWQHFSLQCCRIAIQECFVVLCVLICCWKIWLFLIFYLSASGLAWMRQRETFAPLNGLSSIRLSLGNWRNGTNDSSVISIVDDGWEKEWKQEIKTNDCSILRKYFGLENYIKIMLYSPQVLEICIKVIQSENWLLVLKMTIYIHSYKLFFFFFA